MPHPGRLPDAISLSSFLDAWANGQMDRQALARIVSRLAGAAAEISGLVALNGIEGAFGAAAGSNADGDVQKELDLRTHEIAMQALGEAGAGAVLSEEGDKVVILDPAALYAVAIDPLDGSSNIDTNMSIGTIFSVVPNETTEGPLGPFSGSARRQVAAGFAVYGPQTTLVLTLGKGVDIFALDRRDGTFRLVRSGVTIPHGVREYAINASNYRHWDQSVRTYVDDCLNGADGLRGQDFNMRWIGSLVAEAYRILVRGGIFLYPSDSRPGYENGRLRLLYEAAPIAMIMEAAGGLASTGRERILDLSAKAPHQRVPLIFGAANKVERLERLHDGAEPDAERSPLFGRRGLFRI
jgi:fructose-1,6-bisphosphatase I